MSESIGYNGWTNYETWLVALWLNSDPASYDVLERLKGEDGNVYSKAENLEERVRELCELESASMVSDLVNSALRRVEWVEIVSEE